MSPKIVVDEERRVPQEPGPAVPVWSVVGWLGVALTAVALGDFALAFVPMHFGAPEWEFGTVASVFSGLPLLTMGLMTLWLWAQQRGTVVGVVAVGILLLVLGLVVIALLLVFLLDVPIALRASEGPVRLGVLKAAVKTALLGTVFALTYVVSGILSLKWRPRSGRGAA